jgi:hypothetical protein
MMLQSRRSEKRLLGVLLPSLAIFRYGRREATAAFEPSGQEFDLSGESAAAIRTWLIGHGITRDVLDRLDAGHSAATSDLRQSFRDDPLVSAGGLLLPTGFCRYCLTARFNEVREPRES